MLLLLSARSFSHCYLDERSSLTHRGQMWFYPSLCECVTMFRISGLDIYSIYCSRRSISSLWKIHRDEVSARGKRGNIRWKINTGPRSFELDKSWVEKVTGKRVNEPPRAGPWTFHIVSVHYSRRPAPLVMAPYDLARVFS